METDAFFDPKPELGIARREAADPRRDFTHDVDGRAQVQTAPYAEHPGVTRRQALASRVVDVERLQVNGQPPGDLARDHEPERRRIVRLFGVGGARPEV